MAAEIKEENLSLALRFIVEKFGKDALLNQNKVKAILPDLLSNKFTTETSWVWFIPQFPLRTVFPADYSLWNVISF